MSRPYFIHARKTLTAKAKKEAVLIYKAAVGSQEGQLLR